MKKIFIIAAEVSGDVIGARLMKEIQSQSKVSFCGIGGKCMEKEGLKSLFPMKELSVLGFIELIPQILKLKRLLKQTVQAAADWHPDLVITIDSYGFNIRFSTLLKRKLSNIPFIQYVPPKVFAYSLERRLKIKEVYDHVLTILPFENKYFEDVGIKSTFVGYPFLDEKLYDTTQGVLEKYSIKKRDKILTLMPGSRIGEVKKILPIMLEGIKSIASKYTIHIASIESTRDIITRIIEEYAINCVVSTSAAEKFSLLRESEFAIVKCGTVITEVMRYNVPQIAVYKVNWLSAWYLKRVLKLKYLSLVNIMANKEVIPELIQDNYTPDKVRLSIKKLLGNKREILNNYKKILSKLSAKREGYKIATEVVLKYLS